jgi:hypothetical protein
VGIPVVLSPGEIMQAAQVGIMRQVKNLTMGRRDAHGLETPGWSEHVEGACGELVVAKALNIFWAARLGVLYDGDVAQIEVRTRSRDDYQLLIHQSDHDHRPYVLVRGRCPRFTIAGWAWGFEAKQDKFWKDPTGKQRWAFFMPDELLRSMDTLIDELTASGPSSRKAA